MVVYDPLLEESNLAIKEFRITGHEKRCYVGDSEFQILHANKCTEIEINSFHISSMKWILKNIILEYITLRHRPRYEKNQTRQVFKTNLKEIFSPYSVPLATCMTAKQVIENYSSCKVASLK